MQLSLQFSRLDKVICYSTFCDEQFICLICCSIFVMKGGGGGGGMWGRSFRRVA